MTETDRRQAGPRAAAELAALVRESVTANAAREVLHLRLGALAPAQRRPHHRRLLLEAFAPALGASRTRVFDLPNGDLVAIAPPPAPALEAARLALARTLDAEAHALRRLSLPAGAAELLATAADSLGLTPAPATPPAPGPPAGTAELAQAERTLASADVAPFITVQAVCRMDPEGGPPRRLWDDWRLAWPALAAAILPGRDLAGTPALARRLARLAERRLLAALARADSLAGWRPVGLPLGFGALQDPAFARLDGALPAERRAEVTLCFAAGDILADPAGFAVARDLLARRGYRTALDDAEPALLALLRPAALGLDLLRLRWSPALAAAPPRGLDPSRLVLAGADRPAAIAWGWELGIRLFQGPVVERRQGG